MRPNRNRHPLRLIVDWGWDRDTGRTEEVLECGHRVKRRVDIYGETNAVRRRCRQCGKAAQQPKRAT